MSKLMNPFILAVVVLFAFSGSAFAQPPQEGINQVLSEIGWDMEDLTAYLEYYELSLEDFETVEDLRTVLGTPITQENLEAFFAGYDMAKEDAVMLLAAFGETIEEDYFFIEDLELAINFYRNHDLMMRELENYISAIGITEQEADTLFNHFMALDQVTLETKMEQVGMKLENLMAEVDPEGEITKEQKSTLVSIWEEIMTAAQLIPTFFLVDTAGNETPVSFNELVNMDEFTAEALLVQLNSTQGRLLLDLQVSAEMLGSEFAINAGEKLTDIGVLAGELTELKHEKLPNTASPYVRNMLIGMVLILLGVGWLIFKRKKQVSD